MRGQASVESLAIMAIALLILIIFFMLAANTLSDIGTRQNYDDVRRTVDSLASAADSVYSQGAGASQVVFISLPSDTVFGAGKTYMGAPSTDPDSPPTTINVNVNGTDVFAITRAPLSGAFPARFGTYQYMVLSKGTYVKIYPYIARAGTQSLFVQLSPGGTRRETVWIYMTANETLTASASLPWANPDIDASITPASMAVDFTGNSFQLQFDARDEASGIYASNLSISIIGNSTGLTENLTIPVTVFVS